MTLLNILNSGGLFLLPAATLVSFLVNLYLAFKSSKSGSVIGGGNGQERQESNQNVPFYKTSRFKWSLCWLVFTIILLWWLIVDYKGV
jgi:hypothetical protein